nr:hypothetical protein CFP56_57944 [Quercus suber]
MVFRIYFSTSLSRTFGFSVAVNHRTSSDFNLEHNLPRQRDGVEYQKDLCIDHLHACDAASLATWRALPEEAIRGIRINDVADFILPILMVDQFAQTNRTTGFYYLCSHIADNQI